MGERTLFIAADLPWPPDGGGRIATLRVLESMAARSEVDLIALADPAVNLDVGPLNEWCHRVDLVHVPFTFGRHRLRQAIVAARSAWSLDPYRIRKFASVSLRELITARLRSESYDLAHFDQFGVVRYHDPIVASTLTTQNVESEIYRLGAIRDGHPIRRLWARAESLKLHRIEPRLYGQFDHVFVLSEHDSSLLRRRGINNLSVFPIPVDTPAVAPALEPPPIPSLLTLGSMSWFGVEAGLLWFHREVWPLVCERVPGVRWVLAGPNAGAKIRSLAREPGIEVVGYVDDLEAVLREARVSLVPLHIAGGIRIKLLELLAVGRPCVATTVGAQGLEFLDGHGCFRRDDPQPFAQAVVDLLLDDNLWRRTSVLGWRYVSEHHTRRMAQTALDAGIEAAHHKFSSRTPA